MLVGAQELVAMVTSMAILVRKKRLNKEGCSHLQFRGKPGRMLFSLPTADRRDLGVLAGVQTVIWYHNTHGLKQDWQMLEEK